MTVRLDWESLETGHQAEVIQGRAGQPCNCVQEIHSQKARNSTFDYVSATWDRYKMLKSYWLGCSTGITTFSCTEHFDAYVTIASTSSSRVLPLEISVHHQFQLGEEGPDLTGASFSLEGLTKVLYLLLALVDFGFGPVLRVLSL